MAAGAKGVEMACRIGLLPWRPASDVRLCGFDDLARTQAPRADPEAADAAVHHRTDPLQVRLEPAGGHVVRIADVLAADLAPICAFAALRPVSSVTSRRKSAYV